MRNDTHTHARTGRRHLDWLGNVAPSDCMANCHGGVIAKGPNSATSTCPPSPQSGIGKPVQGSWGLCGKGNYYTVHAYPATTCKIRIQLPSPLHQRCTMRAATNLIAIVSFLAYGGAPFHVHSANPAPRSGVSSARLIGARPVHASGSLSSSATWFVRSAFVPRQVREPSVWKDSDPARHWYCYDSDDCFFFPSFVERTYDPPFGNHCPDSTGQYWCEVDWWDTYCDLWTYAGYCDFYVINYFMNDSGFDEDIDCHYY